MSRPSPWRRWVLPWISLAVFGGAAGAAGTLLTPPPRFDPFPLLQSELRGRALALDAHIGRWSRSTRDIAGGLSTLMAQLPEGPIGTAAEGTLMLYLHERLRREPELGELSVVSSRGLVILSTDGARVGATEKRFTDIAQAAHGPAAAMVAPPGQRPQLVVGAPVKVGDRVRSIFVAWPRVKLVERLFTPTHNRLAIDVVDASGHSLRGVAASAALLDLGTESRRGRRLLSSGAPVAFAPLQGARLVLFVTGPVIRAVDPLRTWLLVAVGIVLSAGVLTLVLGRLSWGRRSPGS